MLNSFCIREDSANRPCEGGAESETSRGGVMPSLIDQCSSWWSGFLGYRADHRPGPGRPGPGRPVHAVPPRDGPQTIEQPTGLVQERLALVCPALLSQPFAVFGERHPEPEGNADLPEQTCRCFEARLHRIGFPPGHGESSFQTAG